MQFIHQAAMAIKHAKLYEGLQKINNELARWVQERTAEVMTTNTRSRTEAVERKYQKLAKKYHITDRKQAQEMLEQENRALHWLNRLNTLLHTCQSEEDSYKVIAGMCEQCFPEDAGCVSLCQGSPTTMTPVMTWGSAALHPQERHVDACRTCCTTRMSACESSDSTGICEYFQRPLGKASLCIPLFASKQIVGMLTYCFARALPGRDHERDDDMIASKRLVIASMAESYALALMNLRLREQLRSESFRDSLTGLYNRRYMDTVLQQEEYRNTRHQSRLSIILLDIDHFKACNDTYGHDVGDAVLRGLGQFLQQHFRGGDIVCRYGGEEFMVILSGASLDIAHQRAKDMWSMLSKLTIPHQDRNFSLTVSVGVAAFPNHGPKVMDVVKAADNAMYLAKARGRNQVVIAPVLQ